MLDASAHRAGQEMVPYGVHGYILPLLNLQSMRMCIHAIGPSPHPTHILDALQD